MRDSSCGRHHYDDADLSPRPDHMGMWLELSSYSSWPQWRANDAAWLRPLVRVPLGRSTYLAIAPCRSARGTCPAVHRAARLAAPTLVCPCRSARGTYLARTYGNFCRCSFDRLVIVT
jgi:hypothetical protein